MHVTTNRVDREGEESGTASPGERDREPQVRRRRRRIDVSDLDARGVQEYVRERVGTDRVSLEHRGAKTYLLVDGAVGTLER